MKDEINVCINSQCEGNVQICKVKVNLNQFEGSVQSLKLIVLFKRGLLWEQTNRGNWEFCDSQHQGGKIY